jgi:pilus assembly protein CpaC
VSSVDYANAVSVAGTTVPGFTTRRVQTEVELESGQSFVIAGLLDNHTTETLSKIPGLASLPVLGKLFESRSKSKSNNELLVIVTPEIVRPIPANQRLPELTYTSPFLSPNSGIAMRQPGIEQTGSVPVHPPNATMPVEQLMQQMEKQKGGPAQQATNGSGAAMGGIGGNGGGVHK